jgi:hypothetical protein
MSDQFIISPTHQPATTLGSIGSVADVLNARIAKGLVDRRFDANNFAYGFEIASTTDMQALGEAVMLNGICYTNATDAKAPNYRQTAYHSEFMTSAMFVIPHGTRPSLRASITANNKPIAVGDFYQRLFQQAQAPLAFVALIEFADFHSVAIGKPPIDGKPVFENEAFYYPYPATMQHNVTAFVIGALTDYNQPQLAAINQQMQVVLYHNPLDGSDFPLTHHAHALTLKQPARKVIDITPEIADQVLHLLIEQSTICSAQVEVYTIAELTNVE